MVTYSHSRLSTFESCPLKYKFHYIEQLEPDIKQSIEGFLGNMVHDTLEWIYNIAKEKTPQLDEVIQHYIENWHKEFEDNIKIVKKENNAEYYFNQGIKYLIDYFQKHYPFQDNTIATEKKIIINLDFDGKYKLVGFIDRLVHHKEKNICEIHDYKTNGFLKTQEELDNDRQLALYSIGVRDLFGNLSDVHLIWHFLAFNEQRVSKRTKEQLDKLKKEIIALIEKIESTEDFKPKPSKLCEWCEFRSYCDAKPSM